MRVRELTTSKIKDSELLKRAREELLKNPQGYWDFLGSIRETITETQMVMLINYQDDFKGRHCSK
jgi:hypothetical protein